MPRYVYASPIVLGKTDWIKQVCQERTAREYESASERQKREFWQFLGIDKWTAWLQHTDQGDYFIHCIEGDSSDRISAGLRKKIEEQHPVGLWIRDFYLEGLGKDYQDPSAQPQLEQILDLDVDCEITKNSEIVSRGFCFPLLPGKTAAHVEFCRACMEEKRELFESSLRSFGIRKISKYLQRAERQDYVVYYQELDVTRSREFQLQRPHETFAPFCWVSEMLTDHTGMDYDARCPRLEFLISASMEAVALVGSAG